MRVATKFKFYRLHSTYCTGVPIWLCWLAALQVSLVYRDHNVNLINHLVSGNQYNYAGLRKVFAYYALGDLCMPCTFVRISYASHSLRPRWKIHTCIVIPINWLVVVLVDSYYYVIYFFAVTCLVL